MQEIFPLTHTFQGKGSMFQNIRPAKGIGGQLTEEQAGPLPLRPQCQGASGAPSPWKAPCMRCSAAAGDGAMPDGLRSLAL